MLQIFMVSQGEMTSTFVTKLHGIKHAAYIRTYLHGLVWYEKQKKKAEEIRGEHLTAADCETMTVTSATLHTSDRYIHIFGSVS